MNSFNPTLADADLAVTVGARQKIAGLLQDAGADASAVRIYVSGGGCGGMTYGMTFAEQPEKTDSGMADDNGFSLVVDPVAMSFLHGAEVDYVDDGVNATFVFNNVFQAVGGSGSCGGCGGAS